MNIQINKTQKGNFSKLIRSYYKKISPLQKQFRDQPTSIIFDPQNSQHNKTTIAQEAERIREQNPFFIITTAIRNRPKLIWEAAKSVLDQSYSNLGWVIVDDGSNYETKESLQKLKSLDKRVFVLSINHLDNFNSSGRPRNFGNVFTAHALRQSGSTKYMVNLDSDDKLYNNDTLKNHYAGLKGLASQSDLSFSYGWREQTYINQPERNYIMDLSASNQKYDLSARYMFPANTLFTKQSAVPLDLIANNQIVYPEELNALEDFPFGEQIVIHTNRLGGLTVPLFVPTLHTISHPKNMTNQSAKPSFNNNLSITSMNANQHFQKITGQRALTYALMKQHNNFLFDQGV
jgi:glycosyltransferase involved in cell wall biosynthesis